MKGREWLCLMLPTFFFGNEFLAMSPDGVLKCLRPMT